MSIFRQMKIKETGICPGMPITGDWMRKQTRTGSGPTELCTPPMSLPSSTSAGFPVTAGAPTASSCAQQSVLLYSAASLPPEDALLPYLTRLLCQVILIDFPQADAETLPAEELQEDYPAGREGYDVLFAAVDKQKLAAVLIFENGLWENVIADFIQDMNGRWKDYRMVSGAISPTGQEGMRSSYQCAAEAARYQYIFTDQPFLSYDELHIPQRKNGDSHLKIFEAVRKDINSSNLLELKAHIEMLVASFKTGHYTIDYCRCTLRDLVTLLYQVMQQNQLDTWMIFGYGIRTYYQKIENIDAFQT